MQWLLQSTSDATETNSTVNKHKNSSRLINIQPADWDTVRLSIATTTFIQVA